MTTITATYSPDDNKLRLTAATRLDPETYARVKAAGFSWAPKLEQFIAPAWTPDREDLAMELAGEIEDEDSTLMDRAEDRAERFEGYQMRRMEEAERARAAVASIADHIPTGQPILVGHHSERHARRDQQRIENGMRRAVQLWRTSEYWQDRAQAAIRHAKYKERPDVRARRIKTLEADQRKWKRERDEAANWLRLWDRVDNPEAMKRKDGQPSTMLERARFLANHRHLTVAHEGGFSWSAWDALRPDEERYKACPAMTPEQVQEIARRVYPARIAHCERWLDHLENRLGYERAMLADAGGTVADQVRPEKGGGCKCWTSPRGGWSYIQKVNKVSVTVLDNWGNGGRNFTRTISFDKLSRIISAAEVMALRQAGRLRDTDDGLGFFLADEVPPSREPQPEPDPQASAFQALAEQARAGVQVVAAPQLFPTPPHLAARMVELAEIEPGQRVLEPSAGTGNLLRAVFDAAPVHVVGVEINEALVRGLRSSWLQVGQESRLDLRCADFLACNGDLGTFDRILMNPPFANGFDIKHILHAVGLLRPGGLLVALCANGPRQQEALRPRADLWEDLTPGAFKEAGTNVNVALLVIRHARCRDDEEALRVGPQSGLFEKI